LAAQQLRGPLPHTRSKSEQRRIGVLQILAENDPESAARHAVFEQTLQALGWSNGRNVRIDYRYAKGDASRVRKFATELVALGPDVILASGSITVAPLAQATRTIPIVFVQVVDPVGSGLVRESGSRNRFYPVRIQPKRKMARAA
jgi:putative ABC transport system substrate-binding protein